MIKSLVQGLTLPSDRMPGGRLRKWAEGAEGGRTAEYIGRLAHENARDKFLKTSQTFSNLLKSQDRVPKRYQKLETECAGTTEQKRPIASAILQKPDTNTHTHTDFLTATLGTSPHRKDGTFFRDSSSDVEQETL